MKQIGVFVFEVYVEMLSGRCTNSSTRLLSRQRLGPLFWSLSKIIMKSQEEEAEASDDSKINQQKPRISFTCLYAN